MPTALEYVPEEGNIHALDMLCIPVTNVQKDSDRSHKKMKIIWFNICAQKSIKNGCTDH